MAVAPSAFAVRCVSCRGFPGLGGRSIPATATLPLQRKPLFCSSLFLSSRAHNLSSSIPAASSSSSKNKHKKQLSHNNITEGDEEEEEEEDEEEAFEVLFKLLEEDLKNDDSSKDGSNDEIAEEDDSNGEITEEDLAVFVDELENALGKYDTEILDSDTSDTETGSDQQDDNDDGDESPLKLRNWQLKKLAKALKTGRRKTSIKNLAADLCLDRALVLELLRNPPPNLLMMSLSLPDEPTATVTSLETKSREIVHEETSMDHAESGPKAKVPVHAMQHRWSAQKRLKKSQVYTMEKVYRRTKRPTNAMISSIVHVTSIPRKRVVKWFEDKRAEEGVPDHRIPYQRSAPETA